MPTYDLYGICTADLERAKEDIERALGIELNEHESGYVGQYYRFDDFDNEEEIVLQRNFDAFENEWTEPSFKDYPLLVYVETRRSAELEEHLAGHLVGAKLLTHNEVE